MKTISYVLFAISILVSQAVLSQTVDAERFEKGITPDVQLLDVRTPEEFQQGHLKNAMLANWNNKAEFNRRVDALDKDKPVFIYCLSGGRSHAAAEVLKERGFEQITELKGGINAWKQANKRLEGQVKTAQISPETYRSMLQASPLVLANFGATWCPPCRKMEPIVHEITKDYTGQVTLLNIDGGSQTTLMKNQQIEVMPTFVLYQNGKEVWRKSGLLKKEELTAALDNALN